MKIRVNNFAKIARPNKGASAKAEPEAETEEPVAF
jgi:hypothetical protein